MENSMEDKIKSVLQNEEMMGKIAELIKGFAPAAAAAETLPEAPAEIPAAVPAAAFSEAPAVPPAIPAAAMPVARPAHAAIKGGSSAAALLSSLRPFLRETRRSKLDALATAMTMAEVFKGIRK